MNDKVQLQNLLQPKGTTLLNKINITIYFENLTIENFTKSIVNKDKNQLK